MNIKVQLCGIVLLLIGFLLYYPKKKLQTSSKRAFVWFYFITLCCVILDIVSIVVIENAAYLPVVFVKFICKSYLISLVATALCSIIYIGVDIVFYKNSFRRAEIVCGILALAISICIMALPLDIFFDSETHVVYTYGPAAMMTYLGTVGIILTCCYLLVKYKGYIQKRRHSAMLLWMLIWYASALIQFLNPQFLVVGFGSCLGVVIIYLQYENPEINMDRESGMFNQTAIYQLIRQIYYEKSSYAVFTFINDHRFARDYIQLTMPGLINALLHVKNACVFKTADDEIVMMIPNHDVQEFSTAMVEKLTTNELGQHDENDNLKVLFMNDCLLAPKPEDFFAILRYCRRKKITQSVRQFIDINESVMNEMLDENKLFKTIEEAINNNRIEVYYQPIYSTNNKKFVSAEALVRMFDADGKMLPVYDAIKASEDSGQIHRLGEIVFEKVCQMIKEQHIEEYGIEYVEINLSMVQCSDEKLAERYIRIMEEYNINPKFINLEITESATVEMKKTLLANMKKLIQYGITFSLDDFGTGQSNLNYIVEMPVQIVKFDREMTKSYFESHKGRFVMNAAMHMIQGMKLHIVSEGIETKEQLETMEELGIEYIQGFYFSKPLPLLEFIEFISHQKEDSQQESLVM